jgi:hypothetical protein
MHSGGGLNSVAIDLVRSSAKRPIWHDLMSANLLLLLLPPIYLLIYLFMAPFFPPLFLSLFVWLLLSF